MEQLERRLTLSVSNPASSEQISAQVAAPLPAEMFTRDTSAQLTFKPISIAVASYGGSGNTGGSFQPADIRHAYGIDAIQFSGGVAGDGRGETIAIIDPYHDANIINDLNVFDQTFGASVSSSQSLYSQYGDASTFFSVVDPFGQPPLPPSGQGLLETALDVEWAHAIAPAAKIVLVEAQVDSQTQQFDLADYLNAVTYARNIPTVSVISLSWGFGEFTNETAYDSYFTTPASHQGVTFVA